MGSFRTRVDHSLSGADEYELEIHFQALSGPQTQRFLLPRRCHAWRKQAGSVGTNRDTNGAQACVVTAEARDG